MGPNPSTDLWKPVIWGENVSIFWRFSSLQSQSETQILRTPRILRLISKLISRKRLVNYRGTELAQNSAGPILHPWIFTGPGLRERRSPVVDTSNSIYMLIPSKCSLTAKENQAVWLIVKLDKCFTQYKQNIPGSITRKASQTQAQDTRATPWASQSPHHSLEM